MAVRASSVPIFALSVIAAQAAATDVYKCMDAQDNVAFQDRPCPQNAKQAEIWLPDAPPAPAPSTTPTSAPSAATALPPPVPITKPPAPLPPLWICRNADDGSTYFSRTGSPPVRYVPLGVLGYPGKSLAQAYGPGGIGVSAPEMRKIPIDVSSRNAIAGDYTPLQDSCTRATREQTCGWLQKQYDDIAHKLRNAFKDQQAILQPQADELQNELNGC